MDEKVIDTQAKAYTLRNLTADDVFPMFRIISKFGIKEFKSCFESEDVKGLVHNMTTGEANKNAEAVGIAIAFEIAGIVVANVDKCRDDIYLFLAGVSGMDKKAIAALPMVTFFEMIIDVIKKDEFKDFFQVVSKLFK